MKKIAIQTELTDFQEPWGGVYHEGEQQPFPSEVILKDNQEWGHTREDVERIIKANANSKFGYALVSTDAKYIVTIRFFKDETDGRNYELDPEEYKDLVLREVSFQGAAPKEEFILDVKVTEQPASSQVAGVDNFFKFTYNSYWGTDPTQFDQAGEAILRVDGQEKEKRVLQSADPANSYEFNIGQYITNPSQVVNIEIRNGAGKARYWNYNIRALILRIAYSENFIGNQTIAKQSDWELRINTEVSDDLAGTVHVRIDDGAEIYEKPVLSSGSISFIIDSDDELTSGSHTIEAWADETVYGMETDHIIATFIKAGGSSNIIVLGNNPPVSTTIYDVANIPFFFYAPSASDGDQITATIAQRDSNNQLIREDHQTIEVYNHSSGIHNAIVHITDSAYANQTISVTISISGASVTHNIRINESAITLQKPAECKVYYDLNEKTNSDADVTANNMKSEYNSQVTSHLIYSENFLQREGVLKEGVGFTGNGGFYIPPGKTLTLEDWQPFAHDFGYNGDDIQYKKKGKTISIEFKAGISSNNDIPIISCMDSKCGFRIYPNRVDVEHGSTHVYSYFPEGERVSFTLVIDGERTECINDKGNGEPPVKTYRNLAYLYMNGVMVRIFEYTTEHWNQDDIQNVVFGSAEAGLTIYSISGWDKNITMKEVIDNFAFDTPELEDKIAIATRNNILQGNGKTIDVTKLHEALPKTPIITWFIEKLPSQKGSEHEEECKQTVFDNYDWDERSDANAPFVSGEHKIGVDGTSSANYPLPYKNWAEKFNEFTLHLIGEEKNVSRYSITYGVSEGEKKFVHKVNFASSEGIFNILAMNMYQQLTIKTSHIEDDLLSKQQQEQADKGHEIVFRKSLSGFPEIGIRKHTDSDSGEVKTEFLSIYNFINNKKTGSMFGMEENYKKNQLWEVDGNRNFFVVPMTEHTIVGGQVVESNGVRKEQPLYYSRVPADSPINGGDLGMCANVTQVTQANDEIRALREIHNWIYSVNPNVAKRYYARYGHYRDLTVAEDGWTSKEYDGITYTQDTPQYRAQKFNHEYTHHLHLSDCLFYFVFCTYILGVDSMDKNMSLFLDDLEDFYSDDPETRANAEVLLRIMLRDTDTTNLFDNSGKLKFKYWHEWNDTYDAGNDLTGVITGEVWNGHDYTIQSSVANATPVFNGRLSGLWDVIVLAKPGEIRDMYRSMRGNGLNTEGMMKMYDDFHKKWCEALYNVDGLGYANTGELDMAYGDKYLLSQYFYKFRERYMDSKYGVTAGPRTSMRFRDIPAGIWMKHAYPIYASFNYGVGEPTTARSIVVGEKALLPCSSAVLSGEVCYINDADFVTEIGIYTATNSAASEPGLEGVQGVYFDHEDFSNLVRLRKFKWANTQAKPNTLQTAELKFNDLKNLKELVMTYCTAYEYSPVIGSEIIEKIDFTGTPINGITIPETETLTELHLPDSLTSLSLRNLPNINTFSIDGIEHLATVDIENAGNVGAGLAQALIDLVGGGGTPALVSGKLTISSLSDASYWALKNAYHDFEEEHEIDIFIENDTLYFEVPNAVYLKYTETVLDAGVGEGGETVVPTLAVTGTSSYTVEEYELICEDSVITPIDGIATTPNGSTLNVETGEVTSCENSGDYFNVRAVVTIGSTTIRSINMSFNVVVRTYPTISIEGKEIIPIAKDYIYNRVLSVGYTASIQSVEWVLEGSNGLVEISQQNDETATLHAPIVDNTTGINATLKFVIHFKTCDVIAQKNILIQKFTNVIDMGLPSGNLWASTNIDVTQQGGFAASPFQYECSFFSWGNTDGHNPTSNNSFSPYTWGTSNTTEPYVSSEGHNISGNFGLSFDAARANLGAPWRTPTRSEVTELLSNSKCIDADGNEIPSSVASKLTTMNGVVGLRLKSKINGNTLFFACTGHGSDKSWQYIGTQGHYMISSQYDATRGDDMYIGSNNYVAITGWGYLKYYGRAVRPIM